MTFAIDIEALRERAAIRARLTVGVAKAANGLTNDVSQLATLASNRMAVSINTTAGRSILMTVTQASACHAPSWTDDEVTTFIARRDRLMRWGRSERESEDIAERLTLRDREGDDRRMCVECHHGAARGCPDGAPLPATILHRCRRYSVPTP